MADFGSGEKSIFARLAEADRMVIYLITLIGLCFFIVNPIGIPLKVTDEVRQYYNQIEDLPEGSKVIVTWDVSSMTWLEQGYGGEASLRHLFRKNGIKIIGISFFNEGPLFWESTMKKIDTSGKEYGVEYCYLGYVPGDKPATAAVADDLRKVIPVDYYGNEIDQLEVMDGIHGAEDFDLMVNFAAGSPQWYIENWNAIYDTKIVTIVLSSVAPGQLPLLDAGQLVGILGGSRGAAEYELLLKMPGDALASMDAQSYAHILLIIFLVVGNIGFLMSERGGKVE